MIGPVSGSAPGLLNVDRTQDVFGSLSWMVDGRFFCISGYTPKKTHLSKLIIVDIDRVVCLSDIGVDVDSWT